MFTGPFPSRYFLGERGTEHFPEGWTCSLSSTLGRLPDLYESYEGVVEEFPPARRVLIFILPNQVTYLVPRTRMGLPEEERMRDELGILPGDPMTIRP